MTFYMIAWLQVLLEFLEGPEASVAGDLAEEWVRCQEMLFKNTAKTGVPERVLAAWTELEKSRGAEFSGKIELMVQEELQLQNLLKEAINNVLEKLNHRDETRLKLLFVADEAKGLLEEDTSATGKGLLRRISFLYLRRAAQKLGPATLLLVMDTTSTVSKLAPAGEDDESRRAREAHALLRHPVCRVSQLDLPEEEQPPTQVRHLQDPCSFSHSQSTMEWLEDPKRWTRYGRLLWGQRYKDEEDIQHVLQLAQLKLLNIATLDPGVGVGERPLYSLEASKVTAQQALTLLAYTAGLEIAPGHHLAQELCASHMVGMAFVSEDRRRLWTVAPLEPVISAAAAASLMDPAVFKKVLEHLRDSLQVGQTMMSEGDRAETMFKLLVTMAMLECEAAANKKHGKFLNCIKTSDFLKLLLPDGVVVPASLEGSFVFFNRILCLDHVPSREEAVEYLKRAVACGGTAGNQNPGSDFYLCIWFPQEKLPLRPQDISYICASVKLNKWQEPKKRTKAFLHVEVGGLPVVVLDYRCYYPAKQEQPKEVSTEEIVFRINGIPNRLAEGLFKDCIPVLEEILHADPLQYASAESRASFRNLNPWSYKYFLRNDLQEQAYSLAVPFREKQMRKGHKAKKIEVQGEEKKEQ